MDTLMIKSKCCANCDNLVQENISTRKCKLSCKLNMFPARSSGYADADYSTLQRMCEEFTYRIKI